MFIFNTKETDDKSKKLDFDLEMILFKIVAQRYKKI